MDYQTSSYPILQQYYTLQIAHNITFLTTWNKYAFGSNNYNDSIDFQTLFGFYNIITNFLTSTRQVLVQKKYWHAANLI